MYCKSCGAWINDADEYCGVCGDRVIKASSIQPIISIEYTQGIERRLPVLGQEVVVSRELDAYNSYRQQFMKMAITSTDRVKNDFYKMIHNLDDFFIHFPTMYQYYIQPMLKEAFNILIKNQIFEVSIEEFAETHINEHCKSIDTYKQLSDVFNQTIIDNQNRISTRMSLIPSVFGFGSIAGFVAGVAFNAAMTGIEYNAIRNANVSIGQRETIFRSLNVHSLLSQVYEDYWNVYQTTNYYLNLHGKRVWHNLPEFQRKGLNIFHNLYNPSFPKDKMLESMISAIELYPYNDTYYKTMLNTYGRTQEIVNLCEYFGYGYLIKDYGFEIT